jgi:hypothetical protein
MADKTIVPDPNTAGNSLVEGGGISNITASQQTIDPLTGSVPGTITQNTATSDSAVISNASSSDTNSQPIRLVPVSRSKTIRDNPLNDFIDVTYHITLAMVSQAAVTDKISKAPLPTTPSADASGVTADDYIVFASTADAQTRKTNDEYYNIQNFTFTNFLGHVPQNPMVAIIWDAKMQMFEPYGFKFREDLDAMSKALGYKPQIEPLNYVYRVEIWFSGWNPQMGEWVQNIKIPLTDDVSLNSVVYYLTITTTEAQVTPQGTEYALSMQTYSHKAMRADALIYRMEGIALKDSNATPAAQEAAAQQKGVKLSVNPNLSFGAFIKILIKRLRDQVKADTKCRGFPGLDIEFEVIGPKWLLDQPFSSSKDIQIAHGAVNYDNDSGSYTYASQNVDILTLLYQVMDHIPLVRQLLLRQDDPEFREPTVAWNIRTNIQYPGNPSAVINGFDGYKYTYYIEPVVSYRSRTTEPDVRNLRVDTVNQQQRAANIQSFGMLQRVYDFYFTNDNSEIIHLDYRFKFFYQEPFPSGGNTLADQGQQRNNANYSDTRTATQERQAPPQYRFGVPGTSQSLNTVLAQPADPQSSTSTDISAAGKHQGLVREQYFETSTKDQTAEPDMVLYLHAKSQYFRYDMISVNMTVRFDPVWLFNPYAAGGDFTPRLPQVDSAQGAFYAHIDRVIFINARKPDQSDFMNPYRTSGGSAGFPSFSGFYQVLTAVNEFEGGKYVQKINMIKYPHLNGIYTLESATASTQNQTSLPVGPGAAPAVAATPTSGSRDPSTTSSLGKS